IGLCKIITETSVATGVRRIEAITSQQAYALLSEQEAILSELNNLLKAPKDLVKAVSQLIEQSNSLQKTVQAYQAKEISGLKSELLKQISTKGDVSAIIQQVSVPNADALKNLAFDLQTEAGSLFCLLVAEIEGKASLALAISKDLVEAKSFNAGTIVRELAKEVQGGGGGQAFLATAGGQNPAGLSKVIELAQNYL
ncbi:MAG: Alanine--tRNA ligase, partial [Bacteroidota bacterium]